LHADLLAKSVSQSRQGECSGFAAIVSFARDKLRNFIVKTGKMCVFLRELIKIEFEGKEFEGLYFSLTHWLWLNELLAMI